MGESGKHETTETVDSVINRIGKSPNFLMFVVELKIKRVPNPLNCTCLYTLADKSSDIVDFCGNTSSNRAGAWSRHEFALIFPTTQQSSAFSMSPRTSPISASGATNIKNVISFVRQCKSTPYLIVQTVSHLVPVIHVPLPQATASVTSSPQPHMDRQRSTLHLRGGTGN